MNNLNHLYDSPHTWNWALIGEIGKIITGKTPSKKEPRYYGDFMPFVKPPELVDGVITHAQDNLSEEGVRFARVLPPNSILVSCIGNLGKTGINSKTVAFNQQINAIVFPSSIEPKFGFYYFQSLAVKERLEELASATTVSIVNKSKFSTIPFPIPPHPEQERIVAKIEELFTQLDAGVAELKQAKAQLKRYRQAVLKAAVEGVLTREWREAHKDYIEPAEILLKRTLRARRTKWEKDELAKMRAKGKLPMDDKWKTKYKETEPPDTDNLPMLPEGWVWTSFGQLFGVYVGATPRRSKPEYWNGDIPWVSSGEVSFTRIKDTRESITELGLNNSSTDLHPAGTILLGMIGEGKTRGQAAILDIPATHNQNSAGIRVSEVGLPPEYVYYFLQGSYDRTRRMGSGGQQPALNKARVQAIVFPLPPVKEQYQIIAKIERRLSVADEIERELDQALARVEQLRQSTLKRAFEGKLVQQDPNDAPAAELLERITS